MADVLFPLVETVGSAKKYQLKQDIANKTDDFYIELNREKEYQYFFNSTDNLHTSVNISVRWEIEKPNIRISDNKQGKLSRDDVVFGAKYLIVEFATIPNNDFTFNLLLNELPAAGSGPSTATDLSYISSPTNGTISPSGGGLSAVIPAATEELAGLLSAVDKTKLDNTITSDEEYDLLKQRILAGTNITITPDDTNKTLTIESSGGGGQDNRFALDYKNSVTAATVVALPAYNVTPDTITFISSGLLNIDDVTTWRDIINDGAALDLNDPNPVSTILLKDEDDTTSKGTINRIFYVYDKGSVSTPAILKTAPNSSPGTGLTSGAIIAVINGTKNKQTFFQLTTPNPIEFGVGKPAIVFEQIKSGNSDNTKFDPLFVGYFDTEADLIAKYPIGNVNEYALIGNPKKTTYSWSIVLNEWYSQANVPSLPVYQYEAELRAAEPTPTAGDAAVVFFTNSIWVANSTPSWVDSGITPVRDDNYRLIGKAAAPDWNSEPYLSTTGFWNVTDGQLAIAVANGSAPFGALYGGILTNEKAFDYCIQTFTSQNIGGTGDAFTKYKRVISFINAGNIPSNIAPWIVEQKKIIAGTNITISEDDKGNTTVNSIGGGSDDGNSNKKESVKVITAEALPAYTAVGDILTFTAQGVLTIDGISEWKDIETDAGSTAPESNTAASRIYVIFGNDSGIYHVLNKGSASSVAKLQRAVDAKNGTQFRCGSYAFATNGTKNAGVGYILDTPNPIVFGTTALTYTRIPNIDSIVPPGFTKVEGGLQFIVPSGLDPTQFMIPALDTPEVNIFAYREQEDGQNVDFFIRLRHTKPGTSGKGTYFMRLWDGTKDYIIDQTLCPTPTTTENMALCNSIVGPCYINNTPAAGGFANKSGIGDVMAFGTNAICFNMNIVFRDGTATGTGSFGSYGSNFQIDVDSFSGTAIFTVPVTNSSTRGQSSGSGSDYTFGNGLQKTGNNVSVKPNGYIAVDTNGVNLNALSLIDNDTIKLNATTGKIYATGGGGGSATPPRLILGGITFGVPANAPAGTVAPAAPTAGAMLDNKISVSEDGKILDIWGTYRMNVTNTASPGVGIIFINTPNNLDGEPYELDDTMLSLNPDFQNATANPSYLQFSKRSSQVENTGVRGGAGIIFFDNTHFYFTLKVSRYWDDQPASQYDMPWYGAPYSEDDVNLATGITRENTLNDTPPPVLGNSGISFSFHMRIPIKNPSTSINGSLPTQPEAINSDIAIFANAGMEVVDSGNAMSNENTTSEFGSDSLIPTEKRVQSSISNILSGNTIAGGTF